MGRGYQPTEFGRYGVEQTDTRKMFDEAIQVIRQAWTQEQVNCDGTYYQFTDVPVRPKPLQHPHPPIWMACLSPETFALAGQYGFHLLYGTVFGLPPDKAQERLRDYHDGLRAGVVHGDRTDHSRVGTSSQIVAFHHRYGSLWC
ncbi:MAG: LLM class flavin-dependent oxidoreductase [Candidatus Tectomicrobia bacterium]|nr:LLM class flavin-dependent oxidoreductase [Candidatus Tectomicrobia bacterium]